MWILRDTCTWLVGMNICTAITQKSLAFLYTNNEKIEREIKETVPFTIATKRIKCLGINLPKETKDFYAKNDKILKKEIKDNTNREICHVPGLEESIL